MRHRIANRHLGRTPSHRKAMYRNMAASLIEHGAVITTEPKAKEVRRFVEKLITVAKRGTLHARRQAIAMVGDREIVEVVDGFPEPAARKTERQTVVTKLFDEIAPRYAGRPGGYTRIIRMGETRIGDSGEKVMLQLISEDGEQEGEGGSARRRSRRRKRAQKRYAMAGQGGSKKASSQAQEQGQGPQDSQTSDQQEQPQAEGSSQGEEAPQAEDQDQAQQDSQESQQTDESDEEKNE
jgi:large subunit ribosomal protein L17